jgi:hypothetical protein
MASAQGPSRAGELACCNHIEGDYAMTVSTLRFGLIAMSGLMLAGTSVPAFAHKGSPQDSSADATGKVTFDPATQKYCFNKTVTNDAMIVGSMLPHVECKTQTQWAAAGVTISRK